MTVMIVMIDGVRVKSQRVSHGRHVAPQSRVRSVSRDRQGNVQLVASVTSHKHICLLLNHENKNSVSRKLRNSLDAGHDVGARTWMSAAATAAADGAGDAAAAAAAASDKAAARYAAGGAADVPCTGTGTMYMHCRYRYHVPYNELETISIGMAARGMAARGLSAVRLRERSRRGMPHDTGGRCQAR